MTHSLLVDTTWAGTHGIGRYAREVTARLSIPWTGISKPASPSAPLSLLTPRFAGSGSIIYSPGFNALISNRPQFVTLHDLIHLEQGVRYSAYYYGIVRPAVRRAGLVFTVSETSRRRIAAWLDDDSVSIVNTGNGCSEAFSIDAAACRRDRPYFVFVGNLKKHKNFDLVLRALARLQDIEVVAVTPSAEQVTRLAVAHGVEEQVTAVSGLSDESLCSLYRGAIATVMPSTIEGFGLPALESIQSGTPVVYWSGCESVAEIVGTNGVGLASAHDDEELAHVMSTASTNAGWCRVVTQRRSNWATVASIVDSAIATEMTR